MAVEERKQCSEDDRVTGVYELSGGIGRFGGALHYTLIVK